MQVYTKQCVPEYGPVLPNPPIFRNLTELRRFLLVKLMNGEKAALSSPKSAFANKKTRTLDLLIQAIHDKRDKSISRPSPGSPRQGSKLYERERFRTKGQTLKVHKIVSGAAPTSTLSSEDTRDKNIPEPWTPVCITSSFPHHIISADSWEKDVLVATDNGLFRVIMGVYKFEGYKLIASM